MTESKQCNKCNQIKPINDYAIQNKTSRAAVCKQCINESRRGRNYDTWKPELEEKLKLEGYKWLKFNGSVVAPTEKIAQEKVSEFREKGYYARIIANKERSDKKITLCSVTYKKKEEVKITRKKCTKCKVVKNPSAFNIKNRNGKVFLRTLCKECEKENLLEYGRTLNGLMTKNYIKQKSRSKTDPSKTLLYTKEEFFKWYKSQPHHMELFNVWVNSGYLTDLIPSVDRINPNKGYSLDNIQLITWKQNQEENYKTIKNGINTKGNIRPVVQLDLNGNFVNEFKSLSICQRKTGVHASNIVKVCSEKYIETKSKNFRFMYKEDYEKKLNKKK